MPSLSFQKQFVPAIREGRKQQTVRAERKRPFVVGDLLALYYAQRTRQCELLMRRLCSHVDHIAISRSREYAFGPDRHGIGDHYVRPEIEIDGARLSLDETEHFAILDGFVSLYALSHFWDLSKPFTGQLVKWRFAEVPNG